MIYRDCMKYISTPLNDESVKQLETRFGIDFLFGGAFASKVYGIDNRFSDNDFYLVYNGDFCNRRIFDRDSLCDYIMLDYSVITKPREYNLDQFPSILFRKESSANITNYHLNDYQTTQKLFEILYSDYIWDSGYLKDKTDEIVEAISFLDVLDYYFSRAYGNYINYLKRKETNAVRILRSFLNVACLRWIIEEGTIPNMQVESMIELFAPSAIKEQLRDVLARVKSINGCVACEMHIYDVGTDDLFNVKEDILANAGTIVEKPQVHEIVDNAFRTYIGDQIKNILDITNKNKNTYKKKTVKKGNSAFAFREGYLC